LFVDNEEFTPILEKIPAAVEDHDQFNELVDQQAANWWQYTFDRPDDAENPVDLSVLAFDVSVTDEEEEE
jgi:hypothetical protein